MFTFLRFGFQVCEALPPAASARAAAMGAASGRRRASARALDAPRAAAHWVAPPPSAAAHQGLTLVHFPARPEPFPTQNIPYIPPNTPSQLLNNP